MDKLLLTIEVPSVWQTFDITVPGDLSAEMLIELLCQLLQGMGEGLYVSSGSEVLCRREDGQLLPGSQSLRESGVRMGDHLLLF